MWIYLQGSREVESLTRPGMEDVPKRKTGHNTILCILRYPQAYLQNRFLQDVDKPAIPNLE